MVTDSGVEVEIGEQNDDNQQDQNVESDGEGDVTNLLFLSVKHTKH